MHPLRRSRRRQWQEQYSIALNRHSRGSNNGDHHVEPQGPKVDLSGVRSVVFPQVLKRAPSKCCVVNFFSFKTSGLPASSRLVLMVVTSEKDCHQIEFTNRNHTNSRANAIHWRPVIFLMMLFMRSRPDGVHFSPYPFSAAATPAPGVIFAPRLARHCSRAARTTSTLFGRLE